MHGRIYVILKESLRRIPIIGWGMQFSQFIFLKRNWETDKDRLATHMQKLNDASTPMWLMIFPEGTNLHPVTRKASKKWADKNKIPDMKHQLLPRSRGLQFCIQQLRQTVRYIYDCTIAYEGVAEGQYASEIFTIQAAYFGGTPPKSVNMYWRRFDVSTIPVDNDKAFDNWLRARWIEKDQLLQYYQKIGRFPADKGVSKLPNGRILRGAGYIETEIKPNRWYEYLQIFAPVGLLALILYLFYGALPRQIVKDIDQQVVQETQQERPQDWEHMMDSMPRIVELASTKAGSVISDEPTSHTDGITTDAPAPKEKLPHKKPPLKKASPRKLNANKAATAITSPKKPLQPGVKPKKLAASKNGKPVHAQAKPKIKTIKPQIAASPQEPQPQPQPQTIRAPQAKAKPSTTTPAQKKLGAKPAPKLRPLKQPPSAAAPPSASGPGDENVTTGRRPAPKKLELKSAAPARRKGVRAAPRKLEIRS
ncbi:MAG: hypothetical protein LQ351_003528 [Letrouitia transgressa]|nr:MAG: hypothetical protein LQ351_003528 [Letrouitia transgressa]